MTSSSDQSTAMSTTTNVYSKSAKINLSRHGTRANTTELIHCMHIAEII